MTETITLNGITYDIDRSEYEIESTQTTLCCLTGPRGATGFLVRTHGGGYVIFTASTKSALAKLSTHAIRAAAEPLFPVTDDERAAIADWEQASGR